MYFFPYYLTFFFSPYKQKLMPQNKNHIFWVSLISAWISSNSWKSFLNYENFNTSEIWTKDTWWDGSFQLGKVGKKSSGVVSIPGKAEAMLEQTFSFTADV